MVTALMLMAAGVRGGPVRFDFENLSRKDAIVERTQELRPEEGLEAAVLQDVAESALCHALSRCTCRTKPEHTLNQQIRQDWRTIGAHRCTFYVWQLCIC